ncbi:MAG: hypothetical protein U9R16_08675 [Campylobacterota bacterium]|nr:hypothetical protein [Campylobacterota bacterium]
MTNSIENNIFDSHFKSATYINNNKNNMKWSFSKKETNNVMYNLIGVFSIAVIIFTIFKVV